MVAPAIISKEETPYEDSPYNHVFNRSGPDQFEKDGNSKLSENSSSAVTGDSGKVLEGSKKIRELFLGLTMNPVVLSIISHFPNKCIPRKADTYVVNGQSDKQSSINNNVNEKVSQTPPQCQSNRGSKSKTKRYAGLILAAMSAMMFSITGLIVKLIPHYHPLTQATWMFLGTVVVAIPLNLLKYVYEYHNLRADNDSLGRKPAPENVETGTQPPCNDNDSKSNIPSVIVLSDKVQISVSPVTVESKSSTQTVLPSDKQLMRERDERRRKIRLFLLLLVRACSGCSGMVLYFYSLKYLNVGDSLVIVCSSPIFVFIIGYLFLGESCGVIPILTIILSIAGVSVITRPPMLTGKENFETEDMIGAGLSFGSMLCIAITIIMMRFLQGVYHGLINLVFGIWGTIQTTSLALAMGVLEYPHNWQDAVLMSATGVLFFLGQTFLAVALQFEEAGPVSLVRTSEVVFAFVWQFIFLNVTPDVFSISGAGLILGGIFLTITRKWVASMHDDSSTKKMFRFLLR